MKLIELTEAKKQRLSDQKLIFNPKPSDSLLNLLKREYNDKHWSDQAHIDAATESLEEFLKYLRDEGKDYLPIRFSGEGYSYNITGVNPLKIKASDGAPLKIKYLGDLSDYDESFLETSTHEPRWAVERFKFGTADQGKHETEKMRGN